LLDRKGMLTQLVGCDDPFCPIQVCEHDDGDGVPCSSAASRMGLEGIVSKKADSRYKSGRSSAWRKTKCWSSGEFVVVGTEHVAGQPPTALWPADRPRTYLRRQSPFVTWQSRLGNYSGGGPSSWLRKARISTSGTARRAGADRTCRSTSGTYAAVECCGTPLSLGCWSVRLRSWLSVVLSV
jgi:hypothetical protein